MHPDPFLDTNDVKLDRRIQLREIGDGYWLATFCIRGGVRSGLSLSREEALARIKTTYTDAPSRAQAAVKE
jgi:hypothetical protein